MAAGIANNPITYGLLKAGNLLKDVTGGIEFSMPLVMGSGTAQTFNVADLMRAGAMSGGILSSIGQMIAAGGNGGITGNGILDAIGVGSKSNYVTRGNGSSLSTMGGASVSSSGSMIGNASGDDMTNKTMTDQTDSSKQQTAAAVEESDEVKLKDVDTHVIEILSVLKEIANGSSPLTVKVDGEVLVNGESLKYVLF